VIVRTRCPVRICDVGGWTDTRFAQEGAVLNIAVSLFAHCLIRPLAANGVSGTRPATIQALDLGTGLDIEDVRNVEYYGNLDLLKAAIKRMDVTGGADVLLWSDTPPGSGVGSSAAVSVALLDGLACFSGTRLPPHAVARMAHELETEELGLESGVQDQYAAALGGVCFMEVDYPRVAVSRLPIAPEFLCEFEERLVVVYVGHSRLSDSVHRRVIERYESGVPEALEAMDGLRQAAHDMKDAMLRSDMAGTVDAINANWEAQKALHPGICTEAIAQAFDIAARNGAACGKANGAGGGGTISFLAEPGRELDVRRALSEVGDWTILPCQVCHEGVRSWVVPGS